MEAEVEALVFLLVFIYEKQCEVLLDKVQATGLYTVNVDPFVIIKLQRSLHLLLGL